jgi:DTW domain-containing protein
VERDGVDTSSRPDSRPIRSRRTPRCGDCRLPTALCLCATLPRLAVRTRLVVVMHRREAISSTNTGRLAARVLEGASVRVRGSMRADAEPLPEGRRLLLFPAEGARVLGPEDACSAGVVLLVPDGSWNQARRLWRRDDAMRDAEPVILPRSAPTRYALRRSGGEGRLCTLEAIARALGVLEGPEIEAELEGVLDRFLERAKRARTGAIVPPGHLG